MYSPRFVPSEGLQQFLEVEHRAIAEAMNSPVPWLQLEVRYVAPEKPRDGMVVLADGATWNPGSGAGMYLRLGGAWVKLGAGPETWGIACGGETEAPTAGTNKYRLRLPYAAQLISVHASLNVAQTSGSVWTVDINDDGASMLSTKLTVDNGERTSATAATPAVISASTIAADSEISIDFDAAGTGGQGPKVYLTLVRL